MRTYKLTTIHGEEIYVECDELREDVARNLLKAKRKGRILRVFARPSVLCWEELNGAAKSTVRSEHPSGRQRSLQ